MRDRGTCTIDGCEKHIFSSGYCQAHYTRWYRHGDPLGGDTGLGEPRKWIDEVALPFNSDECLVWPFGKRSHGYGVIWNGQKMIAAHRLICEAVNGPAPTDKHMAAHSCGKGHEGCVNPNHLRWATAKENAADKIDHGTHNRGEKHNLAKLSEKDVGTIRSLSMRATQAELAKRFNVSAASISMIVRGITWAHSFNTKKQTEVDTF